MVLWREGRVLAASGVFALEKIVAARVSGKTAGPTSANEPWRLSCGIGSLDARTPQGECYMAGWGTMAARPRGAPGHRSIVGVEGGIGEGAAHACTHSTSDEAHLR